MQKAAAESPKQWQTFFFVGVGGQVVFIPLILANAILLEAGLTFLGAGVQPPNPSWGSMISDGVHQLPAAFHEVLVPGIMLVIAVVGINVFGDGLRDALDPRATVRGASGRGGTRIPGLLRLRLARR